MKGMFLLALLVSAPLVAMAGHRAIAVDPGGAGRDAGILEIGSRVMQVGEVAPIAAAALDVGGIGIGAWTFDIVYDASVLSVQECVGTALPKGEPGQSVCYDDFGPGTVRITGASAMGLEGDHVLAYVVFRCERPGTSTLSADVEVWADASIPEDPLDLPQITDGGITCIEPATSTPAAIATPAPVLPPTGHAVGSSLIPLWPIAALAAAGLAATAAGAVAVRRRA